MLFFVEKNLKESRNLTHQQRYVGEHSCILLCSVQFTDVTKTNVYSLSSSRSPDLCTGICN